MSSLTRKQRERLQRQTAILDAAELLFQRDGYEKTTIDDIAHQTELAKGTIYLYFASKEEIVIGLIDRGLEQLVASFKTITAHADTGLAAYLLMGAEFVKLFKQHPDYTKMFALYHSLHVELPKSEQLSQTQQLIAQHKTSLVELMVSALQAGIVDGSVRADIDPVKTALLTALTAASFVHPNVAPVEAQGKVCQISPESLLQYLFELLGRSIKA